MMQTEQLSSQSVVSRKTVSGKTMTPQKLVLAVSAMAILAVTLFPPWLYVYTPPQGSAESSKAERSAGYRLITSPPLIDEHVMPLFGFMYRKQDVSMLSVRLDMNVLAVEVVAILILTGLLYFLLRNWRLWGLNSEADGG